MTNALSVFAASQARKLSPSSYLIVPLVPHAVLARCRNPNRPRQDPCISQAQNPDPPNHDHTNRGQKNHATLTRHFFVRHLRTLARGLPPNAPLSETKRAAGQSSGVPGEPSVPAFLERASSGRCGTLTIGRCPPLSGVSLSLACPRLACQSKVRIYIHPRRFLFKPFLFLSLFLLLVSIAPSPYLGS